MDNKEENDNQKLSDDEKTDKDSVEKHTIKAIENLSNNNVDIIVAETLNIYLYREKLWPTKGNKLRTKDEMMTGFGFYL